jgi:hypothetical protein
MPVRLLLARGTSGHPIGWHSHRATKFVFLKTVFNLKATTMKFEVAAIVFFVSAPGAPQ